MKRQLSMLMSVLVGIGVVAWGCEEGKPPPAPKAAPAGALPKPTPPAEGESAATAPFGVAQRGVSGYTPYDAFQMLWVRRGGDRSIAWVNSGADVGRLMVSDADPARRPAWGFCTQGVVAGLASRGEKIVILATTYNADDVLRPLYRKPRKPLAGSRTLFIPRSSLEFAFDKLLERERVTRSDIRVPQVERADFSTIASLLSKPATDADALDFAILVDPFISNLMTQSPDEFELGEGGLYKMSFCLIARPDDVAAHRGDFVALMHEFLKIDAELGAIKSTDEFRAKVWGREKNGQPETLPNLMTFRIEPLGLTLDAKELRRKLREEIEYLTGKYPGELKPVQDVDALVNPSLLREVAGDRVVE